MTEKNLLELLRGLKIFFITAQKNLTKVHRLPGISPKSAEISLRLTMAMWQ